MHGGHAVETTRGKDTPHLPKNTPSVGHENQRVDVPNDVEGVIPKAREIIHISLYAVDCHAISSSESPNGGHLGTGNIEHSSHRAELREHNAVKATSPGEY